MNLFSSREIKKLLKKNKLQPSRGLGQNFLIDKAAAQRVMAAAELEENDLILEIGPGLGSLTQELSHRAKKIIAIEKDRQMIAILKETLKGFKNIDIIQGDVLKKFPQLKIKNYKVVANLPFYLTAPVIRQFLESKNQPTEIVFIVQKEVAQRICAQPPRLNLLALATQIYAEVKIITYLKKESFWPKPKVDSAIIKIKPYQAGQIDLSWPFPKNKALLFKIIKAGFSQPRKQLANNLTNVLKLKKDKVIAWLEQNNIQPSQRAETLTIKDWLKLCQSSIIDQNFLNAKEEKN